MPRPSKPRPGPVVEFIDAILRTDQQAPRKQRHTAHRIWPHLGYQGDPRDFALVVGLHVAPDVVSVRVCPNLSSKFWLSEAATLIR
jgi:hypothetical protein